MFISIASRRLYDAPLTASSEHHRHKITWVLSSVSPPPPPAWSRDPHMALHAGGAHQERERQGGALPVLLQRHHPVQAARGGRGGQQWVTATVVVRPPPPSLSFADVSSPMWSDILPSFPTDRSIAIRQPPFCSYLCRSMFCVIVCVSLFILMTF